MSELDKVVLSYVCDVGGYAPGRLHGLTVQLTDIKIVALLIGNKCPVAASLIVMPSCNFSFLPARNNTGLLHYLKYSTLIKMHY